MAGRNPGHPTAFSAVIRIWVWARPDGRAHTHQLRIAPPSASQRLVCCQDLVDFLARGRVGALVEDRDARGDDAAVDGG